MACSGILWFLLVTLSLQSVFCARCITYSIDEDYRFMFIGPGGGSRCSSLDHDWTIGYFNSEIPAPTDKSFNNTMYIYPRVSNSVFSCVHTFTFPMSNAGLVEVNVFTKNAQDGDQINVFVKAMGDTTIGSAAHWQRQPGFVSGWRTLRIPLTLPSGIFEGSIVLFGKKSANSVVLVDSFRYVPPGYDEATCTIYEDHDFTTDPLGIFTTETTTADDSDLNPTETTGTFVTIPPTDEPWTTVTPEVEGNGTVTIVTKPPNNGTWTTVRPDVEGNETVTIVTTPPTNEPWTTVTPDVEGNGTVTIVTKPPNNGTWITVRPDVEDNGTTPIVTTPPSNESWTTMTPDVEANGTITIVTRPPNNGTWTTERPDVEGNGTVTIVTKPPNNGTWTTVTPEVEGNGTVTIVTEPPTNVTTEDNSDITSTTTPWPSHPSGNMTFWMVMKVKLKMHFNVSLD